MYERALRTIDPLLIQILHYVRDKGRKGSGPMHILKRVHRAFQGFFPGTTRADLIVVAHSLGAVIAFDYLFRFRAVALRRGLRIRAFITVGSPLPIFTVAMGYPRSDLRLPSTIDRWVNILDPEDGVARYHCPHFPHIPVEECIVETGWTPLAAHTSYWADREVAEIVTKEVLSAREKM